MPDNIETYVHRLGRLSTGNQGKAIVLLSYHCKCAKELRILLKKSNQKIPEELKNNLWKFGKTVIQTDLGDIVK